MGYRGGLNVTQVNPKRGADLQLSAGISIPNNVQTTITFDVENEDTSNYRAPGQNGITIPAGLAGFYIIAASGSLVANATGSRSLRILRGTTIIGAQEGDNAGASDWRGSAVVAFPLVVGDVITAALLQDSGGALSTGQCRLQVYRVAA